ncbi:MAG: NAD(P)H-dependent oxidoreductase [Planctomycetota bacterium]|jgi:flavodoxin|nr:NAD(P)H-dependent oxidoreductase [Planctomycetota bacterium]
MRSGSFAFAALLSFCGVSFARESGQSAKSTLVVYFSRTGNTRALAEQIHSLIGGDIFEITTVKKYPEAYRPTTEVARVELDNDERPELAAFVENMEQYDAIFIGYPNWWGTMPMAFFTFLEHYDLSGKTLIPFCTHGGGGLGGSEADIRRICPKSTVLGGLSIGGSRARNSQREVTAWLGQIGFNR